MWSSEMKKGSEGRPVKKNQCSCYTTVKRKQRVVKLQWLVKSKAENQACRKPKKKCGGKEGHMKEVSHTPRSLSLTLTHCHSCQVQHPWHTSASNSRFHLQFVLPRGICHWSHTAKSLLVCHGLSLSQHQTKLLSCFLKYSFANVSHTDKCDRRHLNSHQYNTTTTNLISWRRCSELPPEGAV